MIWNQLMFWSVDLLDYWMSDCFFDKLRNWLINSLIDNDWSIDWSILLPCRRGPVHLHSLRSGPRDGKSERSQGNGKSNQRTRGTCTQGEHCQGRWHVALAPKVSMSGGWKYSLYSHCLFILAEKSDHISFWSYKMTKTNLGHSFIPKIHISSGCFIWFG